MLRKPQNRKFLSYLTVIFVFFLCVYIYFIFESKVKLEKLEKLEKCIIIKKCNCFKKIKISQITNFSTYNKPGLVGDFISTCSKEADERGVNQNIISFTIFSDKDPKEKATRSELLNGIHTNYKAARTYYTDWVLRIYSDFKVNKKICNEFICKYPNLDWCDMKDLTKIPKTFVTKRAWRFLALGDPLVHKVISRDIDSIVGERERAAVKVWENSDYIFHSMRDHHWHNDKGMFAGTWAAKVNLFKNATKVTKQIIKNGISSIKVYDENLINKFIYKPFEKLFIAHDPYYCKKYKNSHPFPTKRKNDLDWIGSFKNVPAKNTENIIKKCPKECRPSYGQDWEFC